MRNASDDKPLTVNERAQLERYRQHQVRFKEQKAWVEFCRWKRALHGVPATTGTLHKLPGA